MFESQRRDSGCSILSIARYISFPFHVYLFYTCSINRTVFLLFYLLKAVQEETLSAR